MSKRSSTVYDVGVVGGGIIGLAAAYVLLKRRPGLKLVLFEKEARFAQHQTGHNSGVIHSGIYYKPSSLKARLAVRGGALLTDFCDRHGIRYVRCGKVIVAREPREVSYLKDLHERAGQNAIPDVSLISAERLKAVEPAVQGIMALYLPQVAIVDFREVAAGLAREIARDGGEILVGARLTGLGKGAAWVFKTARGEYEARSLLNCSGLHVDRIARMAGADPKARIVPFRGEYFVLPPNRASLVNGLVYPVPDPELPFLGVHFTKTLDGGVHVGPNAVLSLKREGYSRASFSLRDTVELLSYRGFWKMAARHWETGRNELTRSIWKGKFLEEARRLVPSLEPGDLIPAPAGVRAQAVNREGGLEQDFILEEGRNSLHVLNAPSPAATASLAIGEYIADHFGGNYDR
ncbi:MAG: L-2-hydroxyglutarate oxidase [Candidatus Omnitrophica bacterium]|nr:L-2-hydroxyglutarate oxidase [Candidatus Omnitrophota bacterium]